MPDAASNSVEGTGQRQGQCRKPESWGVVTCRGGHGKGPEYSLGSSLHKIMHFFNKNTEVY